MQSYAYHVLILICNGGVSVVLFSVILVVVELLTDHGGSSCNWMR